MLFIVGKILQEFLWPFNVSLILLAYVLWTSRRDRHRKKWPLVTVFLLLLIPSIPISFRWLGRYLESYYPRLPVQDYPRAKAIVVLGGSASPKIAPIYEPEEIGGSRLLPAARLYRAGKAKIIVVSGGVPYQGIDGEIRTEANDMKEILVDMGIPNDAILMENHSRDTYENARETAQLLNLKRSEQILLVTSAFHMRRAAMIYRKMGLNVVPVPTGQSIVNAPLQIRDLVPNVGALTGTTVAIKEVIGHFTYVLLFPLLASKH